MHTEDVTLFNDPPYNTAEDKIIWVEYLLGPNLKPAWF